HDGALPRHPGESSSVVLIPRAHPSRLSARRPAEREYRGRMADSATRQGIDIRALDTIDAVHPAPHVLAEVCGGDRGGMPPNLLRALAHSGNYAVGLYDGERMVGASVAFFAPPAARTMHSHITGVMPGLQSRGLGRLLKQHQREWALAREVGHITWTF